jgi:hypothetical protein
MRNFTVKQLVLLNIATLVICTATLVLGACSIVMAASTLEVDEAHVCATEVMDDVSGEVMDEDPLEDEKIEAALVAQDYYREDVPLSYELQDVLHTACEENGIPYEIALGLIDVESEFDPNAVSPSGCYGLCQLNPKYFPVGLDNAGNIRAGMDYLGENLERYDGDLDAALTAYNAGYDTGKRFYAAEVRAAADYWSKED